MWWSPQQACRSGTGAQDCVVKIRRAHRIFAKRGKRKFLRVNNEIMVDLAQDIRKCSIELKGNQCL
jgi:hypothetical protein